MNYNVFKEINIKIWYSCNNCEWYNYQEKIKTVNFSDIFNVLIWDWYVSVYSWIEDT